MDTCLYACPIFDSTNSLTISMGYTVTNTTLTQGSSGTKYMRNFQHQMCETNEETGIFGPFLSKSKLKCKRTKNSIIDLASEITTQQINNK